MMTYAQQMSHLRLRKSLTAAADTYMPWFDADWFWLVVFNLCCCDNELGGGGYHQEPSSQLITLKSWIFPFKNSDLQSSGLVGLVAKFSVFINRQIWKLLSFNLLSSNRLIFRLPKNPVTPSDRRSYAHIQHNFFTTAWKKSRHHIIVCIQDLIHKFSWVYPAAMVTGLLCEVSYGKQKKGLI